MSNIRIGIGVDVHKFGVSPDAYKNDGEIRNNVEPLKLACLEWSDLPKLAGHSDGDAAAHAIADSILSAVGDITDIGQLIGVDRDEWKNASGEAILKYVSEYANKHNAKVINIVCEIICNKPKISQRRIEAQNAISEILGGVPVAVSSTTTDKLGFLGDSQGIASISNALIEFV